MSDHEVDTYFKDHHLNIKLLSNYIDYTNIEEPVQNLVTTINSKLARTETVQLIIQARVFTLTLTDSLFQLWSGSETLTFLDWD